jgi:indole-3-acetate monooxygenase
MERQGRPEGQPLERARALAPLFDRCAEAVEAERRLVPDLLDGLREAGLFRLLLPRVLDGGEVDPVTFVEVVEEIAKTDGSAAWCLCQAGGCAKTAAYLSPEVARHVFEDPRAVLAWGPGPDARAVAVEGGYPRHRRLVLRQRMPARHLAGRALPRRHARGPAPPAGGWAA